MLGRENEFMKLARASRQMLLLDVQPVYPMDKNAQSRNAFGCVAQEIVCKALRLHPIAIDGRCDCCFDAEADDGVFYEIKSVQRASRCIIYDWRITKEAKSGARLYYAILSHRAGGSMDSESLWRQMQLTAEIFVVPSVIVHALTLLQPLRKVSNRGCGPRFGYNRNGYSDGYRELPVSHVRETTEKVRIAEFWLHDLLFQIPIHT